MTCEQFVGYLLEGEGLDFLRDRCLGRAAAEASELVGALAASGAGEAANAPQRLLGVAVGDPGRASSSWRFRSCAAAGIPQLPRAASTLGAGVGLSGAGGDVAGVSTRKVCQVVESRDLRVSKSEVSKICAGLDECSSTACTSLATAR
jgi:hypothetical protein